MSNLKATQAVTSMRQAIGEALVAANEGRLDVKSYAGISCETCIHKGKHAFQDPCNECSSVRRDDKRDYRTTSRNHWTPSFEAHPDMIKQFFMRYPKNSSDLFADHPPLRCINPRCQNGHMQVHDRGLCKQCFDPLHNLVRKSHDYAQDILLLAGTAASAYDYEACMMEYQTLHTWHRFAWEGKALPKDEDYDCEPLAKSGIREYYEAFCKSNKAPTRRQLYSRGLKKDQVDSLSRFLEIED